MTERKYSYILMLVPLIALVALGSVLYTERAGVDYEISYLPLEFLPPDTVTLFKDFENTSTKTLVLYNSAEVDVNDGFVSVVTDTLDSMRVEYTLLDVLYEREKINLDGFQAVVLVIGNLDALGSKLDSLIGWVQGGGRVMFSIPIMTPKN
jgi:hypothetical protein